MKLIDALEKLSNACGVTGREDEVRKSLKTMHARACEANSLADHTQL